MPSCKPNGTQVTNESPMLNSFCPLAKHANISQQICSFRYDDMAMCQAGCEGCFTDYPCLIIKVSYTTQSGQIVMADLHENDYALSN